MKKKTIFIVCVGGIAFATYLFVPRILSNIIRDKILNKPKNHISNVEVSWLGPQKLEELHIEDDFGTADLNVSIKMSLFGLLLSNSYTIEITGDAKIQHEKTKTSLEIQNKNTAGSSAPFAFPAIDCDLKLKTITITGDEPLTYLNVNGSFISDPGRTCAFSLSADTDEDGEVRLEGRAPNLFTKDGFINMDSEATIEVDLHHVPIPTISGQGGWSIIKMQGQVSSPKLSESINAVLVGDFAQYDKPRGSLLVKTQIINSEEPSSAFGLLGKEIFGTIDLVDVPSSILLPISNKHGVNPVRDIGETLNFHFVRVDAESKMQFSVESDYVQARGSLNNDAGQFRNIELATQFEKNFVEAITKKTISGSATAKLSFQELIPIGAHPNGTPECIGSLQIDGELMHIESGTLIQNVSSYFSASTGERVIRTEGHAVLNTTQTPFAGSAQTTTKKQLDSIIELWNSIVNEHQKCIFNVDIKDAPVSIAQSLIKSEQQKYVELLGNKFSLNANLQYGDIKFNITTPTTDAVGQVSIKQKTNAITNTTLKTKLMPADASSLLGIPVQNSSVLTAQISEMDFNGKSEFTGTYNIGDQSMFFTGKTARQEDGDIDGHIAATGLDTTLLDAVFKCDGLLIDSMGTPLAIEIIAKNILGDSIIRAGGTSPNAAFETDLGSSKDRLFTLNETTTSVDLQLTPNLTRHLLKDFGPVLSDIRTVNKPIHMRVNNASVALGGKVNTLNADIELQIGEVELDSGSLSLKLLPLFNTKHSETIPAFFEPIKITIRKGVISYQKFHLTLANKYSIPYSGTINLMTRELNLHSAIPLTGLGYSIKELRGLRTDIDVPLHTTGTIDHPVTKVDPNFDLNKMLQNAAITAIGDAIGTVLDEGNSKDAPNPLDLLNELLGGK